MAVDFLYNFTVFYNITTLIFLTITSDNLSVCVSVGTVSTKNGTDNSHRFFAATLTKLISGSPTNNSAAECVTSTTSI